MKYCYGRTKLAALPLPSTSPANCRITLSKLLEQYAALAMDSGEGRVDE
jgi:G:T/U-mismatch repair DNA glycosylase